MLTTRPVATSSILPITSKCQILLTQFEHLWLHVPNSQDESSEEFIGEWIEKRGIRDQIVIATKVDIARCNHSLVNLTPDCLADYSIQPTINEGHMISLKSLHTPGTISNLCTFQSKPP